MHMLQHITQNWSGDWISFGLVAPILVFNQACMAPLKFIVSVKLLEALKFLKLAALLVELGLFGVVNSAKIRNDRVVTPLNKNRVHDYMDRVHVKKKTTRWMSLLKSSLFNLFPATSLFFHWKQHGLKIVWKLRSVTKRSVRRNMYNPSCLHQ